MNEEWDNNFKPVIRTSFFILIKKGPRRRVGHLREFISIHAASPWTRNSVESSHFCGSAVEIVPPLATIKTYKQFLKLNFCDCYAMETYYLIIVVGEMSASMKISSIHEVWKIFLESFKIIYWNTSWVIHTTSDYNFIWKFDGTMSPEFVDNTYVR